MYSNLNITMEVGMVLFSALEGGCLFLHWNWETGAIFIFHWCMFGEAYATFGLFFQDRWGDRPRLALHGSATACMPHDILTQACERHESHPNFFRDSIIVGQMLD